MSYQQIIGMNKKYDSKVDRLN